MKAQRLMGNGSWVGCASWRPYQPIPVESSEREHHEEASISESSSVW